MRSAEEESGIRLSKPTQDVAIGVQDAERRGCEMGDGSEVRALLSLI
jgi:hypothetical protein